MKEPTAPTKAEKGDKTFSFFNFTAHPIEFIPLIKMEAALIINTNKIIPIPNGPIMSPKHPIKKWKI